MTRTDFRPRQRRALMTILLLIVIVAVGCRTIDAPSTAIAEPVESNSVSATDSPAAPAAPTPATSVSVHPADLRTGIDDLDSVLAAIASNDPDQISAKFQLLDTPCTTAEGLGGPPKCVDGQVEGTIVSVFPILGSEGTFVTAENLQALADSLEISGLFGVYQVTGGPSPEEAYWPSGDYGVVLAGPGPERAYTFLVKDGHIVRIVDHFGTGPEQAFDAGRGEIIVPPLQ